MRTDLHATLTTIQGPTPCTRDLARTLEDSGVPLLVVGDAKGPTTYPLAGAELLDLEAQGRSGFALAARLPTNHYARKNLGYLELMHRGARTIFETDDDNRPAPSWSPRTLDVAARAVRAQPWVNVYALYTDTYIWPRGHPLDALRDATPVWQGEATTRRAPIQQSLVDGAADVDAVWRLVFGGDLTFRRGESAWLPAGSYCPFNSQSTWWWPEALPLMYLPATCSFRATDIWRGFIAQRCLWAFGSEYGLVFHPPEMIQERNEHDLLRDLRDEQELYLEGARMARRLDALPLLPGAGEAPANLRACYAAFIEEEIFDTVEADLLEAWLQDCEVVRGGSNDRQPNPPTEHRESTK